MATTNPFGDQPLSKKAGVLYVDGSYVRIPAKGQGTRPTGILGWGLVALHDNRHIERSGTLHVDHRNRLSGYYELLGIVQAVLYLYENVLDLDTSVIYCDDSLYAYSQTYLDPNNGHVEKGRVIEERVKHLCDHMFNDQIFHMVMHAFKNVRMVKLKGHSGQVYQSRVDYLARTTAVNVSKGLPPRYEHLRYFEWLQQGIPYWGSARGRRVKDVPFVTSALYPSDDAVSTCTTTLE
jgi:ribonuclease HI